jgi:predicted acetyltransferase
MVGNESSGITIGGLDPTRWDETFEIDRVVFAETLSPAVAEAERSILPSGRVLVAIDTDGAAGVDGDAGGLSDGRIVGTAGSYAFDMTVPGGGTVPVAGVTNVGVLPTHRRRGILRQLMVRQLDDIAAEGRPMAVLNASDARIYGRFGYGMASRYAVVQVRPPQAFAQPAPRRRLELVRSSDAAGRLESLYDAARLVRPGTFDRPANWWAMLLGPTGMWKGGGHHEVVIAHPDGGDPGGFAMYRTTQHDDGIHVSVRELVAATPATHAALWRYLLDIDLATVVEGEIPVDDPLLWLLDDSRALRTTEVRDFLFARVLDTPAVLTSRRYRVPIDVVVEVHDPFRPDGAAAGRFRLEGGPDGATCTPSPDSADVVLGVDALGSLVLGGVEPAMLAATGRLAASPTCVAQLGAAMVAAPAPFCATRF